MPKQLLSVKCPEYLIALIEEKVRLTGTKKSDIVRKMLENSSYLNFPNFPITERSSLPIDPGIYWVYTPNNQLLYLGITENLNRTWVNHSRYQQFIEKSPNARVGWFKLNLSEPPEIEQNLVTQLNSPSNLKNLLANRAVTLNFSQNDWLKLEESASTQDVAAEVLLQKIVSKIISTGKIQQFLSPNYFSETTEDDSSTEIKKQLADLQEKITNYKPVIDLVIQHWPAVEYLYKDWYGAAITEYDEHNPPK